MRLLDIDSNKKLDRVTLYLTESEARQLRGDLDTLLENPRGNHAHISADDFQKEITVCIYDGAIIDEFDERSKELIKDDI